MTGVICRQCGGAFVLDVTPEQMDRWQNGALIQDAMPDLSAGERELLLSGICDGCFKEMFGEEE